MDEQEKFEGYRIFHGDTPQDLEKVMRAAQADGYKMEFIGGIICKYDRWFREVNVRKTLKRCIKEWLGLLNTGPK